MQSKTLKWFSPIIGFAKSQFHSFLFSGFIFMILMVGVSFAIGSNPLYDNNVADKSYSDAKSFGFALAIMLAAFVFAALSFKPFMSKNESDTILSLPIKKTHLLVFQVLFGIIVIKISALISFGVFYPVMNMTKFTTTEYYLASVKSIFTEIIIPMIAYYLISVILIMKTRNFFSSAAIIGALSICSFFTSRYIIEHVGMKAIGADLFEITSSSQTFYYNSALFLPTRIISTIFRLVFNLGSSRFDPVLLPIVLNILIIVAVFIILIFAAKSVCLGELNRPFSMIAFIKVLPVTVLLAVASLLLGKLSGALLYIITAAIFVGLVVLLFVFVKNKRNLIFQAVACAFVLLIPLSSTMFNGPISNKITYDIPNISNIESVYFNAMSPSGGTDYYNNYETLSTANKRYCFTSTDAIKKILSLHQSIIDKIKDNNLINIDCFNVDSNLAVVGNDTVYFTYDDYKIDNPAKKQKASGWGLFDQQNLNDDYWVDLYDANSSIDITSNQPMPVLGNDVITVDSVEMPLYAASFYYKLKDGRWFKRVYKPLPVSWLKDGMTDILNTDECQNKESVYNEAFERYNNDVNGFSYYDGISIHLKDFNSSLISTSESVDVTDYFTYDDSVDNIFTLYMCITADEALYSDAQLEKQDILYQITIPGSIEDVTFDIRSGYTKSINLLNELLADYVEAEE